MATKPTLDGFSKAALAYHEGNRRGKIAVVPTKPCMTQYDLSLAYTPGVAEPCKQIEREPSLARRYTAKGNLVAVVTNGTAVLGLGNIGPLASKPVMEGKAVLFKRFADIDVFDIEVDTEDADKMVETVRLIAPTFGGINLEDIKAPECFYIEEKLKGLLDIPVFHDDQHGTAIISGAALLNALEITGKRIGDVRVVFSGAGAAGIACANFYVTLGVKEENVLMSDSRGVLWKGRGDDMDNPYKARYFRDTTARTLEDAMRNADVFCGVSVAGLLTKEMVKSMAPKPIVFAMANPDPEISYQDARDARADAIIATGRSDFPNQVNNVLGFPFIFRGALDVEASTINEEMKKAVAYALADLAKQDVPEAVKRAYKDADLNYGPEYIIPKPFDYRVLLSAAVAVAKAAMETGVARSPVDLNAYRNSLIERLDPSRDFMRKFHVLARRDPKRIVFPEGTHPKILEAACDIVREGVARPVLLARSKKALLSLLEARGLSAEGIEIIVPKRVPFHKQLVESYYALRQRKGVSHRHAQLDLRNYLYVGTMMLKEGLVDAMLAGVSVNYPEVLRPALQIIGPRRKGGPVAGMYMLVFEHHLYCLADCAVNINPSAEQLAEIALLTTSELERLQIEPRIAMLSFSNFGSVRAPETQKIVKAIELFKVQRPDIPIDGPVQADMALDPYALQEYFPFADLRSRPNLLIFPSLDAGNISLKLLRKFSRAHHTGPIMMGMARPLHLLTRQTEIHQIVDLAAIATVGAQEET